VTKRPAGEPAATLGELIAQTDGPQPWRKAFHAFNAVVIASALASLEPSRGVAVLALLAITSTLFIVDAARLTNPGANELFFRAFSKLASPREARGIASSTWYALGMLVAVAVFPLDAAVSGILVMGLCDPAAAYAGRRFGTRPFLGGTLEGSLAFFAVAALILGLRHSWPAALAAAAASAIAERRSWPLDDNLTVPVVCAGMIQAIEWMA
jgi:dolichol kinase